MGTIEVVQANHYLDYTGLCLLGYHVGIHGLSWAAPQAEMQCNACEAAGELHRLNSERKKKEFWGEVKQEAIEKATHHSLGFNESVLYQ